MFHFCLFLFVPMPCLWYFTNSMWRKLLPTGVRAYLLYLKDILGWYVNCVVDLMKSRLHPKLKYAPQIDVLKVHHISKTFNHCGVYVCMCVSTCRNNWVEQVYVNMFVHLEVHGCYSVKNGGRLTTQEQQRKGGLKTSCKSSRQSCVLHRGRLSAKQRSSSLQVKRSTGWVAGHWPCCTPSPCQTRDPHQLPAAKQSNSRDSHIASSLVGRHQLTTGTWQGGCITTLPGQLAPGAGEGQDGWATTRALCSSWASQCLESTTLDMGRASTQKVAAPCYFSNAAVREYHNPS